MKPEPDQFLCIDCGRRVQYGAARCARCFSGWTLRESQAARRIQEIVKNDDEIAKLERYAIAMRRLGITKWRDIELGQEPQQAALTETQQQTDPEQIERRRRAHVRQVGGAAAGSLLRRLGDDD